MSARVLLLVLILSISTTGYCGTVDTLWARYYHETDMDHVKALGIDAEGNIYAGGVPAWTIFKYLPNGDTAWMRQFSGELYAMVVNDAGEVFAGGSNPFKVIKLSTNGDSVWTFTYSWSGRCQSIDLDESGYIYAGGFAYIDATTGTDYLTAKLNPDGDSAWVRSHNGWSNDEPDYGTCIAVGPEGNVYLTGEASYSSTNWYFRTVGYDPNGTELWSWEWNGAFHDKGVAIDVDDAGNVYATGYRSKNIPMGFEDYLTVKYTPEGDTAWARLYDGTGYFQDITTDLVIDNVGDIYVTGWAYSSTERDYCTIKYSPEGERLWVHRYYPSGGTSDWALGMCLDRFNCVYVTGRSTIGVPGVQADWVTLRLEPDGDTTFLRRFEGAGGGRDYAYDVVAGHGNTFYVGGYVAQTSDNPSDYDWAVVAYYIATTGDADGSGELDIDDAVYLIAYIFSGGPPPEPYLAGDADCSGEVDIDDVVYMIAFIFSGGPEPGDPDGNGVPDC